jgi:hypothetical protein
MIENLDGFKVGRFFYYLYCHEMSATAVVMYDIPLSASVSLMFFSIPYCYLNSLVIGPLLAITYMNLPNVMVK